MCAFGRYTNAFLDFDVVKTPAAFVDLSALFSTLFFDRRRSASPSNAMHSHFHFDWGIHPISTSDGKRAAATSHINGCYSQ
jgi:hypothetical protein